MRGRRILRGNDGTVEEERESSRRYRKEALELGLELPTSPSKLKTTTMKMMTWSEGVKAEENRNVGRSRPSDRLEYF